MQTHFRNGDFSCQICWFLRKFLGVYCRFQFSYRRGSLRNFLLAFWTKASNQSRGVIACVFWIVFSLKMHHCVIKFAFYATQHFFISVFILFTCVVVNCLSNF
eukprot:TRINITY_DN5702_c1_g3_i2.p1 TRINITY_DN5702_c1_g3~~TRINITY_DN5702_c1_g3_i2.p1  ORF type:complete len:103 (-),score=3.97 TRINITY_DN5702_c1_g3_i2:1003-1311(-)